MKTKRCNLIVLIISISCITGNINAQTNIFPSTGAAGIGTTTPNASSLMEINSTTKGLLIPRMTVTQRNAIASPATGLMIYQTNSTPGFYYYSGSAWTAVTPKAKGWALTGNSGTNAATNFIGTTDAQSLVFKVNNAKSGIIDQSSNATTAFGYNALAVNIGTLNSAFGYYALGANTTGYYNTAIGVDVLDVNTTGHYNTGVGALNLSANIGNANSAYGSQAMQNNTTGSNNTAAGYSALTSNTNGSNNVAVGEYASYSGTVSNTVAVGKNALYSNTSLGLTAVGYQSLYSNTTGTGNSSFGNMSLYTNSVGTNNSAFGDSALYSNATGIYDFSASYNTAIGSKSLYSNTSGFSNTADGYHSLYSNTTGSNNIAVGNDALWQNTSGTDNTAVGVQDLYRNTTGSDNVAIGGAVLSNITSGSSNVAIGTNALYASTDANNNTAIGTQALSTIISGANSTALGALTSANLGTFSNGTALGYMTLITASDEVRVGNSSVTSIGGYVGWSNISDGRVKKNIKQNVPGLSFINKLQPVTYNLDLDAIDKIIQRPEIKDKDGKTVNALTKENIESRKAKEQIVYTGFIAQDVEKTAKELNYDFSGVDAAKNDKDLYGLRYSEFVVPLVKAVQELSKMNDEKDAKINDLETRLAKVEALISNQTSSSIANTSVKNVNLNSASLQQNIPNPFNHTTIINYTLPQQYSSAKIIVIDKTGKALKEINITGSGKGSVNIEATAFANAPYNYSLYLDGKLIDTKQMMLAK